MDRRKTTTSTAVKQRYIDKTYTEFRAKLRNEDFEEITAFLDEKGWSRADFIKKAYEIMKGDPLKKKYYLPTADYWDTAFFNFDPICIDLKEAERHYDEWYGEYGVNSEEEIEFDDLWREASEEEIEEYGTYDS